jgi:hypothetical protein
MAKERLDRFKQAIALLSGILTELTGKSSPGGAAEGPRGVDPNRPNRGAGVDPDDTGQTAAASFADIPGMNDVMKAIDGLTKVVKRQGDELGALRKARGLPNALPIERAPRAAPEDVSWPLDLNRPIDRDTVAKETFFDE